MSVAACQGLEFVEPWCLVWGWGDLRHHSVASVSLLLWPVTLARAMRATCHQVPSHRLPPPRHSQPGQTGVYISLPGSEHLASVQCSPTEQNKTQSPGQIILNTTVTPWCHLAFFYFCVTVRIFFKPLATCTENRQLSSWELLVQICTKHIKTQR